MLADVNLAGFENIFGILIFFVIIGRVIAAIRKAASDNKSTPASPQPHRKNKVEQDLENFFKNLAEQAGAPAEKAAPPPPPVSRVQAAAPPPPPLSRAQAAAPPPPPPAARKVPIAAKRKAALEIPVLERPKPKAASPSVASASLAITGILPPPRAGARRSMSSQSRQQIIGMIRDEDSIRKAVVLREILGPPVAMRS